MTQYNDFMRDLRIDTNNTITNLTREKTWYLAHTVHRNTLWTTKEAADIFETQNPDTGYTESVPPTTPSPPSFK